MLGAFAAVTVLTGAGVGAAAAGVFTVGGAGDATTVQCNDRASRSADATIVDRTAKDPVETCRDLWRRGDVGETRTPPPLVGCVTARAGLPGHVSVYPGLPGTCERLGLEPARKPTAEERVYAARVRALDHDLSKAETQCRTQEELVSAARRSLHRHHLTGWTVERVTGGHHCASFTLDQPRATVRVIAS